MFLLKIFGLLPSELNAQFQGFLDHHPTLSLQLLQQFHRLRALQHLCMLHGQPFWGHIQGVCFSLSPFCFLVHLKCWCSNFFGLKSTCLVLFDPLFLQLFRAYSFYQHVMEISLRDRRQTILSLFLWIGRIQQWLWWPGAEGWSSMRTDAKCLYISNLFNELSEQLIRVCLVIDMWSYS